MDEEVEMVDDEEDRVVEWEDGLPTADDLTPLSQLLITPELASAFSITPEPCQTIINVNRASRNTITSIRTQNHAAPLKSYGDGGRHSVVVQEDDDDDGVPVPIPMPYCHHHMIPMPLQPYHGFHPHHYNMYMEQQRDWSGNRFGSIVSHHHNK